MELKDLELSEKDFQLLIDGLEALPHKSEAAEMFGDIFLGLLSKDDDGIKKIEKERERRKLAKDAEKAMLVEDIKILQGKIVMLKRLLQSDNAISEVNGYLKT